MPWLDPNLWGKWLNHGGILTSAPSACSWGITRTDIFVKGADDKIWHAWRGGNYPLVWESHPFESPEDGTIITAPATVSWGPDKLGVLAGNLMGKIFYKYWDGKTWSSWKDLGKPFDVALTSLCMVSKEEGHIDIFATGTDGNLWRKKYGYPKTFDDLNLLKDNDWKNLGNPGSGITFLSAPAAGIIHDQVNVFLVGSNGVLYRKWWNGNQENPTNVFVNGFFDYSGEIYFKSAPAVIKFSDDFLWVVCIHDDDNNGLYSLSFTTTGPDEKNWRWEKFLRTPHGVKAQSTGGCTFEYPDMGTITSILVRGSDNHLWEFMIPRLGFF